MKTFLKTCPCIKFRMHHLVTRRITHKKSAKIFVTTIKTDLFANWVLVDVLVYGDLLIKCTCKAPCADSCKKYLPTKKSKKGDTVNANLLLCIDVKNIPYECLGTTKKKSIIRLVLFQIFGLKKCEMMIQEYLSMYS